MEQRESNGIGGEDLALALQAARRFLARWTDADTRRALDDLAQDAVVEVWRRRGAVECPDRLGGYVRTICRRQRARALRRSHRELPLASLDADQRILDGLVAEPAAPAALCVDGRRVSLSWCRAQLGAVLPGIGSLNERILRGYYEGFSCRELAERYGLPEPCVKARLHRSRRRVRRSIEDRLRAVDSSGGASSAPWHREEEEA